MIKDSRFFSITIAVVFCVFCVGVFGCSSKEEMTVAKVRVSNLQSLQNSSKEEVRFVASKDENYGQENFYFSLKSEINFNNNFLESPQINEHGPSLLLVDDLPSNIDMSAIHVFGYKGKDGKNYIKIFNNDRPPRPIYSIRIP
jgi:hypothetical protein